MRAQSSPLPKAATTKTVPATGKVTGVVFDSVLMKPMPGAQVWLPATTIATTSDENGKFVLDSVPFGTQTIAYSAPVLDSIGFGTRGTVVNVSAAVTPNITIGAPSNATMWRVLCTDKLRLSADSGIAWGRITDASNGNRLSNAPTSFNWYDMRPAGRKLNFAEVNNEVRSDSTGMYYACGLPTDVAITSRAEGDNAASGEVQYLIGSRHLYRVDFTVSQDLAVAPAAKLGQLTLNTSKRPHGKAALRGTVRDGKANGIPGALISIASMDTTVRTGSDGSFYIPAMPSGTLGVSVRVIGYSRSSKLVDLRPDVVTDVDFTLGAPTVLATYNVRTERKVSIDEADFLERRKFATSGFVIDMKDKAYADAMGPLRNLPRVKVTEGRGGPVVTMTTPGAGVGGSSCTPLIYFNGMRTSVDQIASMRADLPTVVEVYNSWLNVPPRYVGSLTSTCGVILYWSNFTIKN
ncbi:MAG: carboxypeptidase-like regulatory domain-containing protein [Gemmatimonadaceae bacterium]